MWRYQDSHRMIAIISPCLGYALIKITWQNPPLTCPIGVRIDVSAPSEFKADTATILLSCLELLLNRESCLLEWEVQGR